MPDNKGRIPPPLSPFVVVDENQPSFNHSGGNGVFIVVDEFALMQNERRREQGRDRRKWRWVL